MSAQNNVNPETEARIAELEGTVRSLRERLAYLEVNLGVSLLDETLKPALLEAYRR